MKRTSSVILAVMIPVISINSQNIPEGYILQYEQNFSNKNAIKDFKFSDPESWRISAENGNCFLEFTDTGLYEPPVRSPEIIAILDNYILGDFILEAGMMQTGREYDHRNMCIFFGMKDSAKYYYVHLASQADENAHNIFLVNNKPGVNIGTDSVQGLNWGIKKWHKIRIERNIVTRSVKVYFDNMQKPIMEAVDWTLVMGYIGFGSFDDTGRIDNIKIWSQTSIPEPAGFFSGKSIE